MSTDKRGSVGRLIIALLLLSAAIGISLRNYRTDETVRVRSTIKAFMAARMARDDAKVRTFLTRDFHRQYVGQSIATLIGGADPHYHRYSLVQLTRGSQGTWIAQVRIEEHANGFIPVGWIDEAISLVPIDGYYRVAHVQRLSP